MCRGSYFFADGYDFAVTSYEVQDSSPVESSKILCFLPQNQQQTNKKRAVSVSDMINENNIITYQTSSQDHRVRTEIDINRS